MKSILVVDDEKKMRSLYRDTLEAEGYRVLEADSADHANEMLKRAEPDLVLLDLRMPEVDGGTMYDVMQMFHRKVKVIVNSAFPVEEQKRRVRGAVDYNDKAEGPDKLLEKIRHALSS